MIYYVGNTNSKIKFQIKPTQILVLGFIFIIIIGSVLLNLPIASKDGSVGFINAFFTATSAVCVTGLVVFNTFEQWTMFGKVVILILIQIGGLGFMTLTTSFFIIMGRKITLKERLVIQEALNQYNLSGMVRLVQRVVIGTIIVELIGALFLAFRFIPEQGFSTGLFNAVFHSVSAFCNAGFDNMGNSLVSYVNDVLVNLIIMILIVVGGIGFTVWLDILRLKSLRDSGGFTLKNISSKLSLHSKLALVITFFLIIIGWLFFFVVEYNNPDTMGNMNVYEKLLASLFQSITTRTAGFNTIDLANMKDASKFMTIIYMFIGGSPAGTAGGIKTVTIGVILLTIISTIRGKERTEAFNRTIPESVIRKAMAVIVISLAVVVGVTMLLSLSEDAEFMVIFFEAMSAFGTVGLSVGLTQNLTSFGKFVISVTMFIGRVGPITMALAFTMKSKHLHDQIKKPEEKVMVG